MFSRGTLLWINRLVWTFLVGAVVLLGSLVSLGRHYIPYIETHQRELVEAFNRRTGLHLSVGHLSGSWQQLSPHFVIDELRLHHPRNPAQTVLHIEHMELQLGIFRSLQAQTLAISRLRASGVRVGLEEVALGQWRLAGFSGEGELPVDRLVDFLAAIYRAELAPSVLDLQFFGGGRAQLIGRRIALQRAGDFRRLNLELAFAAGQQAQAGNAPLRIVVETQGDPRARMAGRGYAEFRGVELTPVLPVAKAFGLNLEQGRVDGASWFEWSADGALEVRGRARMPQLDVAALSSLALAPIENIEADFVLRDRDGKRRLWLPVLTARWHDTEFALPRLSIALDSAQPQRMQLTLAELALPPLVGAALAEPNLPQAVRELLATLSPQGTLRDIHLDLPLRAEARDELRLRARLRDIALQPWQGAPGVAQASGYIDSGLRAGHIDIDAEHFSMAFPHVYREPLQFDRVRGQVGWQVTADRVLVDSGPISVRGDAGRATAQVSLDLPLQPGPAPLMTLQVGLQESAAQYRDRFIPYTLQPALLDWLQRSIGPGAIPVGGFIYRGSLRTGDYANRSVQLFLQTRDAELAYQPGWPPLRGVDAEVWVDEGDLRVAVNRARIYQRVALRDGEVNLQHEGDVGWLTVAANAEADNDDLLRLLRETPLRRQLGAALDHWRWRGPTQSQVRLGLAVSGTRAQEISVDSRLEGGTLALTDQNIVLEGVRGDLAYRSATGLRAQGLSAKWFGKPVTIDVATGADNAVTIDAHGRIAMPDLKQWLRQPLFGFTSGETAFKAALRIADGSAALQVDSDLQGAAINLPAPYKKPVEQSLPLRVAMQMGDEPDLTAELSDWADLRLRWERPQPAALALAAGVVRLGRAGRDTLHDGQLSVTGAVASADLSEWQALLRTPPDAAADGEAAGDGIAVQLRDLKFQSARIGGQTLTDVTVSGRRDSAAWVAQLRAQQIAGTFAIPDDAAQPWRARLDYLRLPAVAAAADENAAPAESALAQIDPRRLFAIDLRIDHLWRGDEEFGWIETQLRPVEGGARLDQLKGQLRAVTIAARDAQPASLTWRRDEQGDRSEFSGRLEVDDIGKALQRWRYEPVLTSRRGRSDIELQWPGRPDEFRFVAADGSAALQVDDGRFLRASSSTTGALKVVGIFNFANFLRRLQFDFSDIYKEGVSFDEMQGSFRTRGGVLTIEQPLEIKSPSSRFRLAGQIDFNSDQTDMELVATLPFASNLPWVAALTGTGLPIAAGVYVASKVFENQFDKFSSATYSISGAWSDPQVKLNRVFDDQLPKKDAAPPESAAEPATRPHEENAP